MNRLSLTTAAALLGAAAAAPALAQSSVTLYGVVDVSIESVKGNDTLTRISSGNLNTSRLGFKGIEDLGGGLKAKFVLESAINADTGANGGGTGRFWDRAAWVGLGGDWGDLRLGRIDSSIGATADKLGTQAYDDLRIVGSRSANAYRRIDNAITYILPPMFAGLTGQLQYSTAAVGFSTSGTGGIASTTAGNEATNGAGRAWSANLGYTVGPFAAEVAYLDSRDEFSLQADKQRAREALGLASWDFGVVKLIGYYNTETSFGPDRLSTWGGKLAFPVTPDFLLTAGYSRTKGTTNVRSDDDKVNIFSLKGVYSLSKRTAVYVWFDHISNGDAASKGIVTTAAGENGRGLALGVRHSF